MNGLFLVDPVMGHAAAASVAVLFLLAALSKLRDIELFHAVLDNYQLLPSALVPVAARVLPTLELAAGVLLLPLVSRPSGAVLALGLLVLVSGAVAVNLRRGRSRIVCGCGDDALPLSAGLLWRNSVVSMVIVVASQSHNFRPTVWLDLLSTLMATLFLLGLYQAANLWLSHQSRFIDLRNAP